VTATDKLPGNPDELVKLVDRAMKGDASTVPALRALLENPEAVELFCGNLARQVERSLIDAAAGQDLAFKEALLRKLELLRTELAGSNPSPLERLLAERAATCWLYLHDLEVRFVQSKEMSIPQADYRQRAIDHAHRRYLTALKTLATVRRLALPVLQVNIAKKQVNIGGMGGADA
jgi:hypothetical protein